MINWKDREYVNARKRVFKNMDTNEILNLELQDDPDNILEESETPLTASNLNLMQEELVNDMSKNYTGANITAPTIEGVGRINKLYGKTVETGTGEKSPDNPYKISCIADDVNLFDGIFEDGDLNTSNGTNEVNNTRMRTKNYIEVTSGNYIVTCEDSAIPFIQRIVYYDVNKNFIKSFSGVNLNNTINMEANVRYIRFSLVTKNLNAKVKVYKGDTLKPWSPYRIWNIRSY